MIILRVLEKEEISSWYIDVIKDIKDGVVTHVKNKKRWDKTFPITKDLHQMTFCIRNLSHKLIKLLI